MTLSYSEHACIQCKKLLLKGLYISLTDNTHEINNRYCYECQKKTYGLNFWKKRKGKSKCLYCDLDLHRSNLFDIPKSYYIFTDVGDGCQIVFCKSCFEAAAPQ